MVLFPSGPRAVSGTSLANLHEPINTVTYDTIHAHVEEGVHGRLVIDCPRVYFTPSPVCGGHETGRKDREPPKANGDLEGRITCEHPCAQPLGSQPGGCKERRDRRARSACHDLMPAGAARS